MDSPDEQVEQGMPERIDAVRSRIHAAADRAGRDPDTVNLIAVSKTKPPDAVREASECGLRIFGENKVQEAMAKIPESPGHLSWHLIGHLQRNKAAAAVQLFDMIHSVDSLRLLETLNRLCDEAGKTMPIFLEVNVAGEGSKYGFKPDELPTLLPDLPGYTRLECRGLMAIPPYTPEPEQARAYFRRLREWRDRWQDDTGIPLSELSMGMSGDFEVAIEEGADWVRVGTAIFGERTKR